MLKRIGVMSDELITGPSSGGLPRTYLYPETSAVETLYPLIHLVEPGDKLVGGGVVFRAATAGTPVTAKLACYLNDSGRSSQLISEVKTLTSSEVVYRDIVTDFDLDLSPWEGGTISVVAGQFDGGRFRTSGTVSGDSLYVSDSFPSAIGSVTNTNILPLAYLVLESPAPEGFTDLVVGDDPIYGDDRSIVKDFTGTPPAPGDQLRYANLTAGGAQVVVRPDLTYTGDYGSSPVPPQDTVDVAYWSGTEWQWYTVTVTFNDTPPDEEPVNTGLPTITGTPVVREEFTTTNGTWSGNPTSFSYRWFVDGIDTGVTTPTYTAVDDAYQKTVAVEVTAANAFGSTSATSEAVGPLGGFAPIIQPFTIQGVPRVGSVLRFNLTVDAVPSAIVTTNWEDATTGEILAVNTNTYRLRSEDLGDMIKVDVVAENEDGQTYYESVSVGPIQAADPVEDSDFIYLDWIALNYPKGDADA